MDLLTSRYRRRERRAMAKPRRLSAADLERWKDGGGAAAAQRRYTQRIAA